MSLRSRLVPLACSLLAAAAAGQEPSFVIGPDPDWVRPAELGSSTESPGDHASQGTHSLFQETQVDVRTDPHTIWWHGAWAIVDPQGLGNGSHVSIDFDPSFEELVLHRILVHRSGELIDKLDAAKAKVLQREVDLEYRIYDGTLSVVFFLEDIRIGDVIECSYSLKGANPAFAGRYFQEFAFQGSAHTHLLRLRVLWPEGRELQFRAHGELDAPRIREDQGFVEYEWKAEDVEPFEFSPDLPDWVTPYAWLEVGEFEGWKEVVDWALGYYSVPDEPSEAIAAQARTLAPGNLPADERALRALRFVQENVRYLGIELGVGSYAPSSPDEVLARRFGDCKDQSLLLVHLLRAMGVPAVPALVEAAPPRVLSESLPSPLAFDHVIVQITLGEQILWVDPTDLWSRGPLDGFELEDYGYALLLSPSQQSLVPIAPNPGCRSKIAIEADFKSASFEEPAVLEVRTVYEGRQADSVRSNLASINLDDYADACRQFYATDHPSIATAAAIEVEDDTRANVVRVREQYSIPDYWSLEDENQAHVAEVTALEVAMFLPLPDAEERRFPLALPHPIDLTCTLHLEVPGGCSVTPESMEIDNDWIRYAWRPRGERDSVILEYRLQTKADSVAAKDVASYRRDVERIQETLTYRVTAGANGWALLPLAWALAGWLLSVLALLVVALAGSRLSERNERLRRWLDAPWFTIWTQPRATVRRALERPGIGDALWIASLTGVFAVWNRASSKSMGDELDFYLLLFMGPVCGPLGGILQLFMWTGLFWLGGRLLAGKGTARAIEKALAYSSLILLWPALLWIPSLVMVGEEMFLTETPKIDGSPWLSSYLLWTFMVEITAVAWAFAALVNGLSVAHGFSRWKALLVILMPLLALLGCAGVWVLL